MKDELFYADFKETAEFSLNLLDKAQEYVTNQRHRGFTSELMIDNEHNKVTVYSKKTLSYLQKKKAAPTTDCITASILQRKYNNRMEKIKENNLDYDIPEEA